MNKKELNIKYFEYLSKTEMDTKDRELVEQAERALQSSYSPYSEFKVGAAVKLSNGETVLASNQENSAYPSGLCAERVALFYAHSKYPNVAIESIAIAASTAGEIVGDPIFPCGACRQVMAETEKRSGVPVSVIMSGANRIVKVNDVKDLIPFTFDEIPKE